MQRPLLDPTEKNETIMKSFLKDNWRNLSMDYICNDIIEFLLTFLGMIRIL